MIVKEEAFQEVLSDLGHEKILAIDTETTGLRSFHDDKLFSIIIASKDKEYYFNFNDGNVTDKTNGVVSLPRHLLANFQYLFNDVHKTWVLANAKFDMHMFARAGLFIQGVVHDVLVIARLKENQHFQYSLAACGERIGFKKSEAVDEFIKKHKLYTKIEIPGKKGEQKNPHYDQVPLEVIAPYGEMDARITYELYLHQMDWLKKEDEECTKKGVKSPLFIYMNELNLTKVCFDMERRGILLDREYTLNALDYEQVRALKASEEFSKLALKELVDSNVNLEEVLKPHGILPEETEKGNASYTEKVLSKSEHPLAKHVLEYRDANKRATTYYSSFLYHADDDCIVHPNYRQSATITGRFSITDPALQTLTAEDDIESEWKVRRSFIPRSGFMFVSIDYKAFEFRAMLDIAGEEELAKKIEAGYDPHQATADMVGISRAKAKTLNFGLLYGMGIQKLADALKVTYNEARDLKYQYFDRLPKVKRFIWKASGIAAQTQEVRNPFGRVYRYPDSKWAYRAPNAIIQGGTADAIKVAMVEIHKLLTDRHSQMVLQLHDELLFEIDKQELFLVPAIKEIMEQSWPSKFHKMECSVSYSSKSWADLVDYTHGTEARNQNQKEVQRATETA